MAGAALLGIGEINWKKQLQAVRALDSIRLGDITDACYCFYGQWINSNRADPPPEVYDMVDIPELLNHLDACADIVSRLELIRSLGLGEHK